MTFTRHDATRRFRDRRDAVLSAGPSTRRLAVAAGLMLVAVAAVLLVLLPLLVAMPVAAVTAIVILTLLRHRVADLAAGVTLLLVQPYARGERIRVHVDEFGEIIEAEVLRVGVLRTTLCTASGLIVVRNAHMLRR